MKKVICIVLILAFALSLVACSGSQSSENTTATTTNAAGTTAVATTTTAGGEPVKGGTLIIADSKEVNSLLWYKSNGNNDAIQSMPFYEALFRVDKNGIAQPYLLESYTADAVALTYTMKLRKGIKFQDGSDFNAESCKWNLDKYKEVGLKTKAFFSNIKSFEVKDDYTVVINLSAWDSTLPYALARTPGYMFSQKAFMEKGEEYCAQHPVGTGPFMLTKWERDVGKTYTKFKDYWGGDPLLDEVKINIYGDTLVAKAALQSGEIHAYFSMDYSLVSDMASKGFVIAKGSFPAQMPFVTYEMNNKDDYFYDVRVRQAVAYAIDGKTLCDVIYKGYATPTNQFAPTNSPYYSKDVVGYEYDVEKAKKLLADAGYANGFSTTMAVRNDPVQVACATAVQAQLEKVGINVKLNIMESGDFSANLPGWKSGLWFHTTGLPESIPSQAASMYKQGLSGSVLGLQSWIHPDDIDDILTKCVSAKTEAEAQKYMQDCQKLLIDKYCILSPIGVAYPCYVKSLKLQNDGINDILYYNATLEKAWLKK